MHSDIIIIADPHLGTQTGDVARIISFIRTIDPHQTKLVFLGDLFHIWAGPLRYHSKQVRMLLSEIEAYQKSGGESYLVVGNREVLFRKFEKKAQYLPFTRIANDYLSLTLGKYHIVFNHGDLVNRQDKKYLIWRRFVRHPLFEFMMNTLPAKLANKILVSGEKNLKLTNHIYRKEFPKSEWTSFIERCYSIYQFDFLFVGHFHPKEMILDSFRSSTAVVVPGWITQQSYGKLSSLGEFKMVQFTS
ncbi:MAG: hypothetical protein HOD92_17565 [Deltaproteobacteria bacterium]|jgi:UDP-2,3-diacylglucosamine hydrolase|nr:hypothetical protein [Deltaproteobacteria bacterium]MBT4526580.1 hypothetical protein [Deltaproteobacteria bacterium]